MSNRIQGPMKAPVHEESSSKVRSDLKLLEEGPQQCILIGIVDVGTSSVTYTGKHPKDTRQIYLIFEYPELKQLIYEDDVEPRSKIKYERFTYSLYEKANLFSAIQAVNNGKYEKSKLEQVDLFEFIGCRLLTSIVHTPDRKNPSIIYDNIESYMKVGKMPEPEDFISDGKRYMFYIDADENGNTIGNNFNTENFAELPQFLREKLMESYEGVEYKSKGGVFAEYVKPEEEQSNVAKPPSTYSVPRGYEFKDVMGKNESYENYRKGGWTDKQLLEKKFLSKIAKAPESSVAPPPDEKEKSNIAPPPSDDSEDDLGNAFADDDDEDLPF